MITLIGLGPGDPGSISRGAESALREIGGAAARGGGSLLLRTERHPSVALLREWAIPFRSLDSYYESASDFQTLYRAIADRVIEEALPLQARGYPLGFAVPGHPLFAEESVRIILSLAAEAGIPTRVIGSGSFVEPTLTAAGASLEAGCDIRDALALPLVGILSDAGEPGPRRSDTSRGLLLYQVYDRDVASRTKLCLMRDYPDDFEVTVVRSAGVAADEQVDRIPLFKLDRVPIDHLTSVYLPPLPASLRRPLFADLVAVMARLRSPEGCPWDREQDHRSLAKFFIEETFEAVEAIETDDPDLLCEELGDVLLQVVFHAQLAGENGRFDADDVTAKIVEKMVRRHPHVFGAGSAADSAEVLRNWEAIKRTEKSELGTEWRPSALDGSPVGLPALMRALDISKRAAKIGFEWKDLSAVMDKVDEELAELRAELDRPEPDSEAVMGELGDLLFTVVQIARWQSIDPEGALRAMIARFSTRFKAMERMARAEGGELAGSSAQELDRLWRAAKAEAG